MITQTDETISIEPMSDYPSAREIARERIADYRDRRAAKHYLTQADIDGTNDRSTVNFSRRAVKYHRVSLLGKLRRLF